MDGEVIELLRLKPDFPASYILIGKNRNAVLLQGKILYAHLLKRLHRPVYSLSRKGDIQSDYVGTDAGPSEPGL